MSHVVSNAGGVAKGFLADTPPQAQASADAAAFTQVSASSSLTYNLVVVGPSAGSVYVSILGSADFSAHVPDPGSGPSKDFARATGLLDISTGAGIPLAHQSFDCEADGSGCGFFSFNLYALTPVVTTAQLGGYPFVNVLSANQYTRIKLTAFASAERPGDQTTAFIDRQISFTFDEPGYSIYLTPGFSNATGLPSAGAGAPEPAEWTLLLTGFLAAGATLRARRAPSVAAPTR